MGKSLLLSWLVLLGAVLAAYVGTVANGYVWDDTFFLSGNVVVASLSDVFCIVTEPLFGQRSYFRPLPLLMIYVEALASGRNPAISHAVNLIVHLANSTLVLLLTRRAMADAKLSERVVWGGSLLIALVYAVHPALSEAVIWISSRFDLMATLCMLLALWVWGADRLNDVVRGVVVSLIFFMGALCKESLVSLPVVLVIYQLLRDAVRGERDQFELRDVLAPRHVVAYVGIISAGIAYLALRQQALSGAELLQGREYPVGLRMMLPFLAIGQYIKLTLTPFFGISPHHSFYWSGLEDLKQYLPWAIAALVLVFAAGLGLLRRRLYSLVVWAWLAALFPVLHVVRLVIGDNLVQERFMYFPLAVLLLLSPYAVARIRVSVPMAKLLVGVAVLFVLVAIPLVRSVVPMWRSDAVLWEWVAHTDPQSREAKANMLWVYAEQGQYDRALATFERIKVGQESIDPTVSINMGAVHYYMGNYQAALGMYEEALQQRSSLPPSYRSNLYASTALMHALLGHDLDARGYIGMALREKVVTVNAVANYLAFCRGRIADTGQFNEQQYLSAQDAMRYVIERLSESQPEAYENGYFCPDVMGMPIPKES